MGHSFTSRTHALDVYNATLLVSAHVWSQRNRSMFPKTYGEHVTGVAPFSLCAPQLDERLENGGSNRKPYQWLSQIKDLIWRSSFYQHSILWIAWLMLRTCIHWFLKICFFLSYTVLRFTFNLILFRVNNCIKALDLISVPMDVRLLQSHLLLLNKL